MRSRLVTLSTLITTLALPVSVSAQTEVQRFVLAAGANFGGDGRVLLRYAVSDAERFARVLTDLGGVSPSSAVVLKEPRVRDLVEALDQLSRRASEARWPVGGGRTEVLVYYSGHADEKGLLLGNDRYSYQSLRDRLDEIPADVRMAVLDACASGAFTRLKGGKARQPFLVDEAASTQGYAFLTSSTETEAAQESDHIGASYFTHYLVSGLRGAADVTGEGKVTLSEAYQFAFNETLGKTAGSGSGAQHPSYEISLSGTGDVVITDIRQTTAAIVLGESLDGRIFIRNAKQELVVELYKPQGRRIEIGLEAGEYEVRVERPAAALLARSTIGEGQRAEFTLDQFTPTTPEPVRRRGGPLFGGVDGRWRLGLRIGSWNLGGLGSSDSAFVYDSSPLTGGATLSYWINEDWSLDFTTWTLMKLVDGEAREPSNTYIAAFLVGGKRHLSNIGGSHRAIRPFLSAAVGPYVRSASGPGGDTIRDIAAGGTFGGGVDIQLARWSMVGIKVGHSFTADFSRDVTGTFGAKTSYGGVEVAVDFSVLWGKGRTSN